ncbi:hypothetical protein Ddye_014361 [Dipteronia dyeriana]|uniref:Uncharacterized protein n=1 Tax=Dipteronia dyeriana TaxID=168575 RepID=A0AAE0CKG3_9ROSI|nr:hypothetical protein Ddye_014361 [Dipteronia dyeriana]
MCAWGRDSHNHLIRINNFAFNMVENDGNNDNNKVGEPVAPDEKTLREYFSPITVNHPSCIVLSDIVATHFELKSTERPIQVPKKGGLYEVSDDVHMMSALACLKRKVEALVLSQKMNTTISVRSEVRVLCANPSSTYPESYDEQANALNSYGTHPIFSWRKNQSSMSYRGQEFVAHNPSHPPV